MSPSNSAPVTVPEVSAPASSANLGPGFDCLAVGLELRCTVTAEPSTEWSVEHRGQECPPPGSEDIVLVAAQKAIGDKQPLRLTVVNDIPIGRGLGSSAAASAAGAAVAWLTLNDDPDPRRVYHLVTEMEGHPDNAAAAVYGGLTLVPPNREPVRLPWHPSLHLVLAIPDQPLSTSLARAAVPEEVPIEVTVRSLGRMGALVAGLLTGDPVMLDVASGDELHEEPRGGIRPEVARLMNVARRAGAWHAAWSGAGPSVIALVEATAVARVARALAMPGIVVLRPAIATVGLHRLA